MARLITDLEDAPDECFVVYGTLLGFMREKNFISFDSDLDFGVITEDHTDLRPFMNWLVQQGYKISRGFQIDGQIYELTVRIDGLGIDFFWFGEWKNKGFGSFIFHRKTELPLADDPSFCVAHIACSPIKTTRQIEVLGNLVPIPEDAEQFLEDVYTSQWHIPDPNWVSEEGPAWNELPGVRGYLIGLDF